MLETVLVWVIVAAAIGLGVWSFYRSLKSDGEGASCHASRCQCCASHKNGSCSGPTPSAAGKPPAAPSPPKSG